MDMQKIIFALRCARICHNKIKCIEDFDHYIAEIAYSRNIEVQGMQYPYAVAKVLNYDAIKLQEKLYKQTEYFERRIDALHRRASLHKGEICGSRARAEITGMITVLNALGYEVKMNWDLWCAECEIIPEEFIVIDQKLCARLDSREFQLEKKVKSLSAENRILRSELKQWEVE